MLRLTHYWRPILASLALPIGLTPVPTAAQGRLDRVEGHYIGVLDFFNTQTGARYRVPHPNPSENGLQGKDGWIGDKTVEVRGLMKGAQLNVDWWTLFGEPVANYTFVWQSSGRYDIRYTDPKKGPIIATVTRDKLTAHPALLKRFDRLKPVETGFEIQWRIGDQSSRDREAFKRRYRIFGSIGSAAPHVKTGMVTRLHDGMLIYEPSGKKPFSSPTSPPGGWKAFGSLPDSFDGAKIKMLGHYFSIATGQRVNDFRATKFRWPLGEMKAIAEAIARIEAGEELPPTEEAKKETAKALPGYTAKDEWAQAIPAPSPPVPKRAADGLFYYTDAGGNRLFPTGYAAAEPFGTGSHIVARVQTGIASNKRALYNYIDVSGRKVLPFDTASTRHVTDGVYTVSDPSRPNVINNSGIYDAVRQVYLLTTEYNWANMGEKNGAWQVTTRKITHAGSHNYTKKYDHGTYQVQDVTSEHGVFLWDSATRTLKKQSYETKNWQATAGSFKGPLF